MKKSLLLSMVLISVGINSIGQIKKSVLFIGNSYTNNNNLPNLVQQMAASTGDTLVYSAHTPGGAQLVQHAVNATAINLISTGNWHHVVLQEQSQKPSFSPVQVARDVFAPAKTLCDTIRFFDSCTQPIFYMTWGRKFGDAGNCSSIPWVCTYQGMDSALAASYNAMGQQNDAYVSPVGAVWRALINTYPTLNLYAGDNSHPNIAGSYAAACTFYTVIFRKDPSLISFNSSVNATTAANIRNTVKTVVFDSLTKWNVGNFDPQASFLVNSISANGISLTNNSSNVTQYSWDFGDGATSTDTAPSHLYSATGNYIVTLIASKCGKSDTTTQSVSVNSTSQKEIKANVIGVYPNPSSNGFFTITKATNKNAVVYNYEGKAVKQLRITSNSQVIDLGELPNGLYKLSIEGGFSTTLILQR